ncbi:MAG: endonuclease domain-containing protein [Blastomonas sp.]
MRNEATPAERSLWSMLRNRQLCGQKFSRQMPVGPYFADFLCRSARLIIEIDGYSHDVRPSHDRRRDAYLANEGYRVLRFSNDDVNTNLEGVVQAIAKALAVMRPPPAPPASGRGDDDDGSVG